ncbi:flavin reductase like domain-containing protein [Hypoxylon sp. FL0543]|nr:flavin reductase like domain-containing protein [Hypoxylon sp. FL0543]
MKSLRGLRWASESTRPRYVPFQTTPIARASFLTWNRSKAKAPGVASTPRSHHDGAKGGPVVPPKPPKPPQHVLSHPMRAVMRQLPHPVVVITTLENTHSFSKFEEMLDKTFPRPIPRAMTVSSFTSLSVDPVPRVTFNITLPSTTYQALAKCGKFNAHILTGDEYGARIADLFTRGNRPAESKPSPETKDSREPDLGVLAGLEQLDVQVLGQESWQKEWELAKEYGAKVLATIKAGGYKKDVVLPPSGTLPVLQGKGILHVLKCQYRNLTPPADGDFDHHAIVIGEVIDIIPGKTGDESDIALAYADRAYRQMGEKLLERPTTNQENLLERPITEQERPSEETTPLPEDLSAGTTDDQKQS